MQIPQHLAGVAADTGPAEVANAIDHVRRPCAGRGEVAAVDRDISGGRTKIGKNGLERR